MKRFDKLIKGMIVAFCITCAFLCTYLAGFEAGRIKGFNQGVDFGTIEIQNLMGWDAPAAESVQEYEQMIKEQRDEQERSK